MRASIRGIVRAVERDDYNPDKPKLQVYVSESPRYAPDIIEGPIDLLGALDVGDRVEVLCTINARKSKAGNAYLSIWGVDVLDHVKGAEASNATNGKATAKV